MNVKFKTIHDSRGAHQFCVVKTFAAIRTNNNYKTAGYVYRLRISRIRFLTRRKLVPTQVIGQLPSIYCLKYRKSGKF